MMASVEKACQRTVTKIARSQYLCMEMGGSWGEWSHATHAIIAVRIPKKDWVPRIHVCHLAPGLASSDRVATPKPLNLNWMDRCDYGIGGCFFLFVSKKVAFRHAIALRTLLVTRQGTMCSRRNMVAQRPACLLSEGGYSWVCHMVQQLPNTPKKGKKSIKEHIQ
jgi:hypothetical protein